MKQETVPIEQPKPARARARLRLFVLLAALLALVLACGSFAFLRQDVVYRMRVRMRAWTASVHLEEAEVKTKAISPEDLLADERCVEDQSLLLVNGEYPLPERFNAEILSYKDTDVLMNTCIQDAYAALSAEVRERFGQALYVRSAYRTAEEQQEELETDGELAAPIGASEHQTGLSVDVYISYYAGMAILKTEAGRWINDRAWEYGFIVRYPSYGTAETGFPFEPWHLRYVGEPHAEIMARGCLTLEEYIPMLTPGVFYRYGDYLISRQQEDTFSVPESFRSAVISADNTGGWILTFLV